MQFATAKHINRIWRLFKALISASTERIEALEKILQTDDIGDDVLTITDAAYRILAAFDRNGRARFEVGITSREAETEGDHEIGGALRLRDTRIMESDDYGIYYILDCEDRILFMIDREGKTDFKGIPRDIKEKIDEIEKRLSAIENQ